MADHAKKILIMEDERPMAHAMELKLSHSGFEPTVAFDGETGLQLLKDNAYAMVLLDLMMPKVDGFAVLQEMKNRGDKTPVIVLSNLSQEQDVKKTKDLGAKDFFVKSDTPIADIVEQVRKHLGA